MNQEVRAAVITRANGKCEHCGKPLNGRGELDHFFGRAKAPETLENCWFLALDCGRAKTDNRPDAASWLLAFMRHALHYGYKDAQELAATKFNTRLVKNTLGAALCR